MTWEKYLKKLNAAVECMEKKIMQHDPPRYKSSVFGCCIVGETPLAVPKFSCNPYPSGRRIVMEGEGFELTGEKSLAGQISLPEDFLSAMRHKTVWPMRRFRTEVGETVYVPLPRKRIAFYPGSFDPFTNGHLDVLRRALMLFDRVIIGIGEHPQKTPMFDAGKRTEMIKEVLGDERLQRVDVVCFEGLTVDAARFNKARFIIRGVRDSKDFEYERQLALMQRELDPRMGIVFMLSSPKNSLVSSTLVRQLISEGGDPSRFVPPSVKRWL